MSLNRGPHLNSRMCLEWMQWVVERSFMLYLESLKSFSPLKEEVSCQLFGRQGHSVFLSFSFFCIFQLHPEMRKLDHPQCYDELSRDPICNSDGLPERGQMFFSFLMSCTNWFKNLKSQCPFSVPNCRITGQEYRWGSSHADSPLLLTPWEFGNKRKWFPSEISDSDF